MSSIADVVHAYSRRGYVPLVPIDVWGVSHLIHPASTIGSGDATFGDMLDHFSLHDNYRAAQKFFGEDVLRAMTVEGDFPLSIHSCSTEQQSHEHPIAIDKDDYQMIEHRERELHMVFARAHELGTARDNRVLRFVELLPGRHVPLQTTASAVAIVPMQAPLMVFSDAGHDMVRTGHAAIIGAGARLMVKGRALFVFHPTGFPETS